MRIDHQIIYDIIQPGARVLDLGCGDGELLLHLVRGKHINAQGIEVSDEAIYKCVEKGLSVLHSDIDSGLKEYPDASMDYVILNQTMQETKHVFFVIQEALRVGRRVIVGFPNFASLKARLRLFFRGRVPITAALPYRWYDTPNLHFLSLADFKDFCRENRIRILESHFFSARRKSPFCANICAENGIFVIARDSQRK